MTTSKPTPIYYAYVEGASFEWSAVGHSPEQAVEAVMSAWREHVRITDADPDYIKHDDVQILPMIPGQGYRDHDSPCGRRVAAERPQTMLSEWQRKQARVAR